MGCAPSYGQNETSYTDPTELLALHRFTDVDLNNTNRPLLTDSDLRKPIVSLEQALEPIVPPIDPHYIRMAKKNCHFPSEHGLTRDESAAIYLYTMLYGENCVYDQLNEALQSKNRSQIIPWLLYLTLLKSGIDKLPNVTKEIWRGMYGDDMNVIKNNTEMIWCGLSSGSTSFHAIKEHLGPNGILFRIDSVDGKNVTGYTTSDLEEVLLWPGMKVRMDGTPIMIADGLYVVCLVGANDFRNSIQLIEAPPKQNPTKLSVKQSSPILSVEQRSPMPSTEQRLPVLSIKQHSPVSSTEQSSPMLSTEQRSPILITEQRSPVPSIEHHSPVLSTEERSPVPSNDPQSPVLSTEQRSPILSVEQRSPVSSIGVKGAIGAGKSTLLAAILGEINLVSGKLRIYVDAISYAPQLPWIFSDTIRANILLGKPMNEERYKNVIKACCLDIDLQNFGEVGDLLMIGDKGINLSGGQKARISLARALYTDADLYLFDDPLAAVDAKVAKNIFDQCIGSHSFLCGKTRILVTHQTQFLVEADQIILLRKGHIDELGIEQPFVNKSSNDTLEIDPSNDTSETDSSKDNETDWTLNTATSDINSIVKSETSIDGGISWSVWLQLFTAPPLRWFGFFLMIIFMLGSEALYDFANNWLALWSGKSKNEQRSSFYAYVYLGVIFATLIVALIRAGYMFLIMLCGSTYFHNRMLKGILYTSLRFFESNPSGRILNRASKDQQVLDESLPLALIDTMQYLLMTLGSIAIIGMTNKWVLLILIPLVPTVLWLRRFYIRSSRQLKRLESVTRSPIYELFSSSLDGLTSIRAFDVQDDFLNMFMERIDTNSRAYFILFATARWFGLQLDLITSLLTLITAILAVALRHQIDPSAAALSITYCITLTGLFQWAMRQSAEAENFMTSAERIHEYGQLVPEGHQNIDGNSILIQPADDWPSHGIIDFKDYTFRYRPELDPVLKNLNLRIESKEKIGIIGRTGAGKSSLIQALFRLVDQSAINGTILIDDIDIGRLSLDHLRSHLSVIPQVPVLFGGTLRYNIDPFEQFSDEECLTALEAVQLKQLVCNHPDGLHLMVTESGTNLSAGERQLVCVARAILKRSHILLIDEATANVDHRTDMMIQQVIGDKFRDRTILTIAHRLNTVANSNRILLLQQGEVAYFGVPNRIHLSQGDLQN
ncbi:unnamed protein product [Rotaria sp. Silwood1]|nr:unnamed protein product [Rotaria sp. Silwood1]